MNDAEIYSQIIMADDRDRIVSETPTIYEDDHIVRIYEFEDGAVVDYEWQGTPDGRTSVEERFNHKFTLVKLPNPNPSNLKTGLIRVINYPRS
ncbi:MAG: hypothetical protein WKF92_12240 [Pyrinomonadaceae bacterium]